MAQNGATAERELLKTIEGKPGLKGKVRAVGLPNALTAFKSSTTFFLDKVKKNLSSRRFVLSFAAINKILIGVFVVVVIVTAFTVLKGVVRLGNIPQFDVSQSKPKGEAMKEIRLPVKDSTYYNDILVERNIFSPFEEKQIADKMIMSQINEIAASLRVVGISWTEGPEGVERSVMIEDTKTELTYFLYEGDTVSNLMVKKILKESIVLGYGNEELELR